MNRQKNIIEVCKYQANNYSILEYDKNVFKNNTDNLFLMLSVQSTVCPKSSSPFY